MQAAPDGATSSSRPEPGRRRPTGRRRGRKNGRKGRTDEVVGATGSESEEPQGSGTEGG